MDRKGVYSALKECGLPCAYMGWNSDSVPELPYVVFLQGGSNDFIADNERYAQRKDWVIELYQEVPNAGVEQLLEEVLESLGIFTSGANVWVNENSCIMTPYYITI